MHISILHPSARSGAAYILCGLITLTTWTAQGQISSRQFEDVTVRMGLGVKPQLTWGCAWGDGNGDGQPDLFVSNHYQVPNQNKPFFFFSDAEGRYRQDSVPFYERTPDMHGAGWFDYDNDGDQDLLISTGRANRNSFLVNNGSGQFLEMAEELGADFPFCRGRTPLFYDHNRDGYLDILLSAGPALNPEQLPTTLALQHADCSPSCFTLVDETLSGILPNLAATQSLLIDPDGDDLLNPMIVAQKEQPWGATGCLPFDGIGIIETNLTIEILEGDFNGDMKQDLYYIRNRLEQSYVDNPFPVFYPRLFRIGLIDPELTNILIQPANGEGKLLANGSLRYKPIDDFVGKDSMRIGYCDSTGNCQSSVIRYQVMDILVTPDEGFYAVPKSGFLKFPFDKWVHPYRHRLRANLIAEGIQVGFSFRTSSDSILLILESGVVPASSVFIGSSGYNPAELDQLLLKASDSINHGSIPPSGLPLPYVYLGFDVSTNTWVFTIAPKVGQDFVIASSILSPDPLQIVAYNNVDSLPILAEDNMMFNLNGGYVDATVSSGINFPNESNAGVVGDFDNDMDLDIYLSNGIVGRNEPNTLLENNGSGVFTATFRAGSATGTRRGSAGAVSMVDFDRDGNLDLFVCNGRDIEKEGPYELFRNTGNSNRWLEIDLEGTQSNRDGIGAVVRVWAGGKGQIRNANGGIHRYVQDDDVIHFGMGPNKMADSITVRWPSGARSKLVNKLTNQLLTITEPTSGQWNCFPPVDLKSGALPGEGFKLRWDPVDCATGYRLGIRLLGSPSFTIVDVAETSIVIPFTFFTGGSVYQWRVQAICDSGLDGAFSRVNSFVAETDCAIPTHLMSSGGGLADTIKLNWDADPNALAYVVYRLGEDLTPLDSVPVYTNSISIPSIFVGSLPFYWYVRSVCPFGVLGDPSEVALFTPLLRDGNPSAGIQLQPNPAQTSVQLHGLQTRASYRISDLAGRELLRGVTDPGQSISVDGLASGLYHFSWQTGSGPWTALPLRVQ